MFVRRKANKSGTFSVQVVDKIRGHYTLIKSFGASKSEEELVGMEKCASDYIMTFGGQAVIDFRQDEMARKETTVERIFESIVGIRHDGVRLVLDSIYTGIGLDAIGNDTLKLLSIARISHYKRYA